MYMVTLVSDTPRYLRPSRRIVPLARLASCRAGLIIFPMRQHRLTEQLNSPCSIQTHGRPGKTGSILRFAVVIEKCNNSSMCCGGFHSRATLSGSRYQGRTPPNVVPRTPCPKAKARTGHNARHGLPHSTCTPFCSCLPETSLPFWAAGTR